MQDQNQQRLRILLVKTRGRATATLQERIRSEDQGDAPRSTLFQRTLQCDVIDEGTIEDISGFRGRIYSRLPRFVAQAMEAKRRASDYDVVMTWSERHTIGVAAVFAMLRVKTPHMALMFWISKPTVKIPLRLFKSGVTRIVTWSSVQRLVAVERIGFEPENVVLLSHPVDLEFFQPKEDVPRFIFSAGSTERDFPTLVEAVKGLGLPLRIAASLVVSRNGIRMATTDVRDTLEHTETVCVEQLGSLQLRDSYAAAHVVVVPLFQSDIDAGINVILEGMAMGRPVIASRTLGQTDVIRDGENALFVAPGDVGEMRSAIEGLLANPAAAAAMGARARTYVEQNHRLEDFIEAVRCSAVEVSRHTAEKIA